MTVHAEGVVHHLVGELTFRLDDTSSMTVETGLVLGPFVHGYHLRVLAVAHVTPKRDIAAQKKKSNEENTRQ